MQLNSQKKQWEPEDNRVLDSMAEGYNFQSRINRKIPFRN